ncbi:glycosyltransferase [Subtercola endophyticus]|uniref:glycosyltransferase n=1 Tax=Subtercola endophyticus TaxID=2895559 RepID=UPI001E4A7F0D|nr:glycosyltransferase [Subtercola endophyticus]UFS57870.1 glycosyltransferase [Subtercola endophyticus]
MVASIRQDARLTIGVCVPAVTAIESIRLIPELRSVHITRYYETTPAHMLYFTEKYDLVGVDVPKQFRKVNLTLALRLLRGSRATVLEMPEPLWVRFLPTGVAIALTWKLSGLITGRKRILVTYAMENNELGHLIGGNRRVPPIFVRAFGLGLGLYIRLLLDKIAFATEGSQNLYMSIPFVRSVEHRLFEELPSDAGDKQTVPDPDACVFVGVLEERKGVAQLLTAWEEVERLNPTATLTIIGPGPLADRVTSWASQNPSRRKYLGQLPRAHVQRRLATAVTLIAPSIPDGRWREQVGLPIKEGLSHGLTVVTTDQTGLASWLRQHGHQVVAASNITAELPAAIKLALEHPLARASVIGSLPHIEGRYQSDAWIHER